MAFRSFVGTHGRPMIFCSNKAKTFTAADTQLRALLSTQLSTITRDTHGGLSPGEGSSVPRQLHGQMVVQSVLLAFLRSTFKKQFKVMLQKQLLTLAQMQTLVIELQSSIADRWESRVRILRAR